MHNDFETTRELDARIKELAAELANSIYPLLLERGLGDAWLVLEVDLWTSLCAAVKEWAGRWRLTSIMGHSCGLRNFVAADLAERAFVIVRTAGIDDLPRQLRRTVVESFRSVLSRGSLARERPSAVRQVRRHAFTLREPAGRDHQAHMGGVIATPV